MSYSPFILGLTDVGQSQASKFFVADGNGDLEFQDDDKIIFGDGADASIYWYEAGNKVKAFSENVALELGHASSTTTILGNLVVSGTTTTVDVEVVNTANGVIFEGASADDYETTLLCVDPTADRTINLADSAGTLVPFAVAPTAGVQITATPGELNILDGCTANFMELNYLDLGSGLGDAEASKAVTVSAGSKITLGSIEIEGSDFDINGGTIDGVTIGGASAGAGTFTDLSCSWEAFAIANLNIDGGTDIGDALADDDLFIVSDVDAAPNNKKVEASRLKTYLLPSIEDQTDVASGGTVSANVTLIDTGGTNYTVKLPENAAAGKTYTIKKTDSAANTLTIQRTTADTIDGATSVVLYHQYESVTVVSDGANYHII